MPETHAHVAEHDVQRVDGVLAGWKCAQLWMSSDGCAASLAGVAIPLAYGAHDVARCAVVATHVPPHPGCRCGFYAWRHREVATRRLWHRHPALVEVELFGRFEEYEFGYIAAAQVARLIRVLQVCGACAHAGRIEPAVILATDAGEPPSLIPVCGAHAAGAPSVVGLADLAALLGAPIQWLPLEGVVAAVAQFNLRLRDLPRRHAVGHVEDLLPGDVGHVFPTHIAQSGDGRHWIASRGSLCRPADGIDVPVRRRNDGGFEALVEGLQQQRNWTTPEPRHDSPVVLLGSPVRVWKGAQERGDAQ